MHDSAMNKITYYYYCIHSDSDYTAVRFIAEDLLYCVLKGMLKSASNKLTFSFSYLSNCFFSLAY